MTFFTVCGGGDDYEFLLGAIEHHAAMGSHFVLDTTPSELAVRFTKLPDSVVWMHEPAYGHGWKEFRLRSAVEMALKRARLFRSDVLVYLDSDEFYTENSAEELFPRAAVAMVKVNYVHWRRDGNPYVFGESEWHCRLWPTRSDVAICTNAAWIAHPKYNGNPEHHPFALAPDGLPVIRVEGEYRHHLHYAVGSKAADEETAFATIDGWPDGGKPAVKVPWPTKLALWKEKGIPPSEAFR